MKFAMDLQRGEASDGLTASMRVTCREVAPMVAEDVANLLFDVRWSVALAGQRLNIALGHRPSSTFLCDT